MKEHKHFYLFLFSVFLVLDFFTKNFVKLFNIQTNTGIIDINYVTNKGSLFGLFASSSFINLTFVFLSIIALYFLIQVWVKYDQYKLGITLIATGILGNLIDRISYGYVIDWLNLNIWPIFNLADSLIVIGVIYLAYLIITEDLANKNKN